jgi:hypothetical protein
MSNLTVTTPAAALDLTTIETVRGELNLPDNAHDERLKTLITQASDVVARYCNRTFGNETVTETFRLDVSQLEIVLSRFPVISITSITENGTALTPSDYELDAPRGIITRLHNDRPCFWSRWKIVVVYSAGFDLLDHLPHGVERAAIQLVKSWFLGGTRDPLLRSESVNEIGTTSYRDDELPPDVRLLLAPARNFRTR